MSTKTNLLHKAQSLPKTAGCYLMKNSMGEIIYVGKAKNLRARVKTYFDNSQKFIKTQYLVKNTKDFEFILTNNEVESLILENNLIKEHSPKYNIRLRDDKTYPYVQINFNEKFPRLEYTRSPKKKKNYKVFGPFPEAIKVKNVIRILTKALKLRDCSISEFRSRKTPCLLYQMNQCSAPCVDYISHDDYLNDLKKAQKFFNSQQGIQLVLKDLNSQMQDLSDKELYEKAILARDAIEEIKDYQKTYRSQLVEFKETKKDTDIIAYYLGEEEIDLAIYSIRNSLLIGNKSLHFFNAYESKEDFIQDLPSILFRYYESNSNPPREIITDISFHSELLENLFQEKFEINLKVQRPKKGVQKLLQMTRNFAENSQRMREENKSGVFKGLQKLKLLLQLDELPRKLECYDVAIWQGDSPSAAQVTFVDGFPEKNLYRHYHLQIRPEGNNDFAMLEETLERRIKSQNFPDLFIVDGGRQQLQSFLKILNKHELTIPVIALAKAKVTTQSRFSDKVIEKTEERIFIPDRKNPYILSKDPELFRILVQMRDEAHRFSRKLHHKSEKGRLLHSDLSKIPGIGEKTVKRILRKIDGPIHELTKFTVKELSLEFQIKEGIAQKILDYLRSQS